MSITPASSTPAVPLSRRGRKPSASPPAFVSLIHPGGRRRWWWYLATCPVCRSPHLGRERELENVARIRRLPCGHYVKIVVARVYGKERAA